MIVIAVGSVTDALQNIKDFFWPSETPQPIVQVQLPGEEPKKCQLDSLPQKPFKYSNSTKILLAVFEGATPKSKAFGTEISMSIADRLDEYGKDSLYLGVEDIEVYRLDCFVQSHSEAREILDSLGADIFLWGNNFCALSSEEAKFCPKATLTKKISPLEARGKQISLKEQLAITDLDLPSLTAERPYQLLNFIFGAHFYLRDKLKKAKVYFEKAGENIYKEENGIEYIYHHLAYTYAFLSDNEKALEYYDKILEKLVPDGDKYFMGVTLNNIGDIYEALSQYDTALTYYDKSLSIVEELGDLHGESVILNNIGLLHSSLGEFDSAIEYYNMSLNLKKGIEDIKGVGAILNNIGEVYRSWGKYINASNYYEKSLKLRIQVGDRMGEGITLNNMGLLNYALANYEMADDYFRKSLKISEDLGDRRGEGTTLSNIGMVYHVEEVYDQALIYFEKSLMIHEEVMDLKGQSRTLGNIGVVYMILQKYQEASESFQRSLEISEEIGDLYSQGITLNNMGSLFSSWGKYNLALEFYERGVIILEQIKAAESEDARENMELFKLEMEKSKKK